MKQKIFVIVIVALAFSFAAPAIIAQETTDKKQQKAEKKKLREEQELADWNESKQMATDRRFVFKANQLITKDGTVSLDPKINFFYVIDDYSVIQFGFDGVFIGGNGVGGITSDGTVESYKVIAENPKKPVQVELIVKPKAGQGFGIGTLVVKFYGDGYGEIQLNSNGYRLKGQIFKPEAANIHMGNKL